jgi:hypothetical protein
MSSDGLPKKAYVLIHLFLRKKLEALSGNSYEYQQQ